MAVAGKDQDMKIFAGGNDYKLYEIDTHGELVSETEIRGVVRKLESGDFIENDKPALFLFTLRHDKFNSEFFGFLDPVTRMVIDSSSVGEVLGNKAGRLMINDMSVADVNKDGLADLIIGNSHKYGINWYEQQIENGKRRWICHPIDPYNSQYHDLMWIDIDGDGECELVTGKRYRAHSGHDPGAKDDLGTYYFKWNGESFTKQIIDFGPARVGTGVGLYFDMADLFLMRY